MKEYSRSDLIKILFKGGVEGAEKWTDFLLKARTKGAKDIKPRKRKKSPYARQFELKEKRVNRAIEEWVKTRKIGKKPEFIHTHGFKW